MKLNKLFVGLLCMTTVFLGACSDDDYTPAEKLTNAQVYFPDTNPSTFTLDMTDNVQTVNVPISRIKTDEALTVNLKVSGTDELVSVPSSVTFKAEEATVNIPVSVNSPELGYNNPREISLAIADSSYTTLYGFSGYDFTVIISQSWTSLGYALYTEDFVTTFFGVDNVEYEVELQECDQVPGYYRLVNPYGAAYPNNEDGDWDASKPYYFEIHAENPNKVYIPVQGVGMNWGYGEFMMGSLAGYYLAKDDAASAEQYYGTLEGGVITFPASSLLIGMAEYKDGTLYTANGAGAFRVVFPGVVLADYSLEIDYLGIFTDKQEAPYAVINAVMGPDVTSAKAVVVNKSDDAAAVADAIVAGEIEATDITAGSNNIPLGELTGELQVVAVTLDAEGALAEADAANFEYYGGGGASPWQSLGIGLFTDDIVLPLYFDAEAPTYEVEILESTETPGIYRLMNPYAEGVYPYSSADLQVDLAPAGNFLSINAEDPEGVYVPTQALGMNWGKGDMVFASWGAYYYEDGNSLEDLKTHGYLGTLVDGVINFPVFTTESGTEYQGIIFVGTTGYYTGGKIQVTLPSAVSAVKKKAAQYSRNAAHWAVAALHGEKFQKTVNKSLIRKATPLN